MPQLEELLAQFANGDMRAASRLMSVVERGGADAERVLDAMFPRTGRAHRIAITGPGGAGKSTLINELARAFRASGQTVGVVAEDPSSPFSGGAILGDRVRMGRVAAHLSSDRWWQGRPREALEAADVVARIAEETNDPALTLITCYPFRYIGSAPQRFIVRAQLVGS